MKTLLLSATALLLLANAAAAQAPASQNPTPQASSPQSSPFDMSTERPEGAPAPTPQATPQPAPPQPAAPQPNPPAPGPSAGTETPPGPPQAGDVEPSVDGTSTGAPLNVGDPTLTRRYLLPFDDFTLSGEDSRRTWSVYLTPVQAASETRLRLAYQNAVVVAPEASRLGFTVNGQKVVDEPIASSSSVKDMAFALPSNSLKPGWNDIEISAVQRHRTDCTAQSTYELWTQIDPARTFLDFSSPEATQLSTIEDLRAVGVDAEGRTRFNLVVPGLAQPAAAMPALRLAEALALTADMPGQSIAISARTAPKPGPGSLNVLVGTPQELSGLAERLPTGSDSGGVVGFVDDKTFGASTLVVSGPNWGAIGGAVESLLAPLDRSRDVQRTVIATRAWRTPEPPMLFSRTSVRFSDLGIRTQEFSGRRFRTEWSVGVPSDFYAQAYGEARILLDAAYSSDVQPGSHIDIFVNGSIASTLPITNSGGSILRHLPIKIPMTHFKPGVNTIAMEAVLMTEADALCAPGTTALPGSRFVLFDSSEWAMPDYARITQRPNLSAMGGTGAPYGRSPQPVPVLFDRADAASMSAAATLLGRMSVAAGRPIDIDLNASPAAASDRNALFIGPIASIAPEILSQVGVSETSRTGWSQSGEQPQAPDSTDATFERWRDQLRGSDWRGQVSSFQDWLERTFDISLDTLRIRPAASEVFTPGGDASLLVAQNPSPSGTASWTVVTAPSAAMLTDGANALTRGTNWSELGGHITTYNPANERLSQIAVGEFKLSSPQPATLSNYRLIAANWLSANVLAYSAALAGLAVVLGLATSIMLSALGRER
ncbi:MAG: cellulose biosynthesis cyclic di-GMP-binding regulatory protein BcsB [Methylobacterium mesophilicum]|nr:cellulose biosynthesis cyclic di-GMP-binding regulatory protein BcsB [Methylobacterium mesophilicum]